MNVAHFTREGTFCNILVQETFVHDQVRYSTQCHSPWSLLALSYLVYGLEVVLTRDQVILNLEAIPGVFFEELGVLNHHTRELYVDAELVQVVLHVLLGHHVFWLLSFI